MGRDRDAVRLTKERGIKYTEALRIVREERAAQATEREQEER